MAFSKKTRAKGLKVVDPNGAETQETQSEEPTEIPVLGASQEPGSSELPKKRGRPEKKSFWDFVNEISPDDWKNKRCYIYAYLIEPYCNVRTEGEPGYLRKFYEAIDPEFFLREWGSGKYFLRLKEKRPGASSDRDIDKLTFEIFNPSHPPKLPRKLWESDPRNERWLAMLPKEEKPTSQAETMNILNAMFDMQDRIEERIRGAEDEKPPALDPTKQLESVLTTASKIAELTRPAAPQTDPTTSALALAKELLTIRADNPMVDTMRDELKAMREDLSRARDDNAKLQREMFESQIRHLEAKLSGSEKPKDLISQAKELASAATELKGLFGITGDSAAGPIKSKMSGWMELATELVPGIINSPIMNSLAARLMPHANGAAAPPQTINLQPQPNGAAPAAQQNGAGQGSQQELFEFVNRVVSPALIEYLEAGNPGGDFAEWLYDGFPARVHELQTITHAALPGMQGAQVIIEIYKHSPVWTQLQRYPEFPKFVEEFCAWKPEEGEPAPASTASADEHESTSKGDF